MKRKIEFKKAFKKQLTTFIILFVGIMSLLLLIDTKNDYQFYLWLFFSLVTSYVSYSGFKKQAKEAMCPHCQVDLFEIIESANALEVNINFCLACGEEVEI